MGWRNTASRYGSLSVALHWLMLVLIAATCLLMEFRSVFPKDSAQREAMALWHYTLGLSVFGLAWLRLLARQSGATPRVEPEPGRRQRLLASAVHRALYLLMFALPLLGWLTLGARGDRVLWFGVELPLLPGTDADLAQWFESLHTAGGIALYALLALHASAALYHHHILRDNTLRLMLPRR